MALALHRACEGRRGATVRWLSAGAGLGVVFLGAKVLGYRTEDREGLFTGAGLAVKLPQHEILHVHLCEFRDDTIAA